MGISDKTKGNIRKIIIALCLSALGALGVLIAFYATGKIQAIVVETITNDKIRPDELSLKISEIALGRANDLDLKKAQQKIMKISKLEEKAKELVSEGKIFERATSVIPIGSVIAYTGTISPANGFETYGTRIEKKDDVTNAIWLVCNGAELKVSSYEKLSNVIGNIYGGKLNPATKKLSVFNLPNYCGMFLRGVDLNNSIDPNRNLSKEPQNSTVGPHRHGYQYVDVSAHAKNGYKKVDSYSQGRKDVIAKKIISKHTEQANDIGIGNETKPINMAVHYLIRAK